MRTERNQDYYKESEAVKHRSDIITKIITVLLIVIMLFSAYKLYEGFSAYWKDYNNSILVNMEAGRDDKTVNWKALKEKNKDVVGWLYCPETVLDYPVVHGTDNDKYLHTSFDGAWSAAGTLFADASNNLPFIEPNTVIYGHHMNDGSMFHDLDNWWDEEYLNEHDTLYIYTPAKNYHMDVISCGITAADDEAIYGVPFTDKEDVETFINRALEIAMAKNKNFDISTVDYENDRFVTLSTCAYTFKNARTVLIGKITQDNRNIDDIEARKAAAPSKFKVFVRMIKDIVTEGYRDFKNQIFG